VSRLADEYDAAQERGEVTGKGGGNPNLPNRSQQERLATVTDIGLTRKQVHEAGPKMFELEHFPGGTWGGTKKP